MCNKLVDLTKEEEIKKRVDDNIGLIYKPVKKFYNSSELIKLKYEFEELLSVATLSLYKASSKFDESKGFKFSTYAFPIIKFALIEFTRKDKWHYDRRSIKGVDTYLPVLRVSTSANVKTKAKSKGESDLTLEESLVDKEDIYNNLDNVMIVDKLLSTCSEREKGILKGYFFEEKNQTQLAKEFNTTQSYISVVIKRNLKKFKKMLGGEVFQC